MVKHKKVLAGIVVITILIFLVLSISSLASNSNPTTLTSQEKKLYSDSAKTFFASGGHDVREISQVFEEMPVKKSIAACEEKLVSNSRVLCYRLLSSARDDLQERKEVCSYITTELCDDFPRSVRHECIPRIPQTKTICELGAPFIR